MRRASLLAWALAVPATALAARPMVTDDAGIVDAKACQLESWARQDARSTQAWAMPACNPSGRLEIAFGGALTNEDGASRLSDNVVQVKGVLRALDDRSRWGRAPTANGWPGDPYANLALSVAMAEDGRWTAHLNAGAVHRRDTGRTLGTWGFGNEVRMGERVFFYPELFRADFGRPFYQAGLRYWVVKDRFGVDGGVGERVSGSSGERWFSIGLRIVSPSFLP